MESMPETRLKPFDSNFVNSVKLGQRSILSYLSMLFNRFASFHAKMSAEYTSERRALIDNGLIKLIDDVRVNSPLRVLHLACTATLSSISTRPRFYF